MKKRNRVYRGPDLKQHPLSEEECLQLAKILQTTRDDNLAEQILSYLKSKGKNNFGERNYRPDIRAYLMTNDFYGITSNKSLELSIGEIRQRTHAVLETTIIKLEKTLNIKWKYWNKYPGRNEFNEKKSVDDFCNSTSITNLGTVNQTMENKETIPALVWNAKFNLQNPYVIVILGKDGFGKWIFAKVDINYSEHLEQILPNNETAKGFVIPFQVYKMQRNNKPNATQPWITGNSPGNT